MSKRRATPTFKSKVWFKHTGGAPKQGCDRKKLNILVERIQANLGKTERR